MNDSRPDADAIRAWLREHPDFLLEEPELLAELVVPHPAGTTSLIERQVELPIILLKEIEADLDATPEGETMTLPIVVSSDTDQIVLGAHRRGTWLLTFSLAGMAAIGALVSALLVGGWNRFLAREGDPALRTGGVPA